MERYTRARGGPRQQAAVAGDLEHRAPLAEAQRVGAGVGAVEEAQPVAAALDGHARRDGAVDEERVAAEAEVDVLLVAERAVLVERVIGDHDRHVELALGQVELGLQLVLEHVHGDEPVVHGLRRAPVRVIVVPERGGVLIVGVVVVERAAGRDDVHRMAVVGGRHVAAVQVHVGLERQRVLLAHDGLAALAGADRRAGVDAFVAVDRRLEAGQDLRHALADRHLVMVRVRVEDTGSSSGIRGRSRWKGANGERAC